MNLLRSFYRGYVACKGKKAISPFKNVPSSELLTLEEADRYAEYAGVLDEDSVLIDIDDSEQAQILLKIVKTRNVKCKVIATSRGYHFLFWNNGELLNNRTHCKLAIGITADIKGCGKASYEVLKVDGKTREIVYDSLEYQSVPRWLMPINSKVELLNMVEGEGRNNALFSYILPLQQNQFSKEECKECIGIINEFILKEPLADSELAVILRDGAFNKPCFFTARGTFLFDEFAKYVQKKYNIVKINNKLHMYKDGYYQNEERFIEAAMISEIPTLNQSKRKEVLAYLDLIVPKVSTLADAHLVAFKNGILNVRTKEMMDFSPDYIITNMIPHKYVEGAQNDLLDSTMNKLACNDEQVLKLLYQSIGMCFFRRNELRKSFFLVGQKRNGKSTFLDMISTLLGEDNISNLDLSEIGHEFKTAELASKLANIGDDINDEYIPNSAIFKKVVSGDKITVARKGEHPFVMGSYAKCFFSANSLPRIGKGKDSGAVLDRLVIIPFDATFSKDDPDYNPYIKYDLRKEEVMEALIVKAVDGLREVLHNQRFGKSDRVLAKMEEYERSNNPIMLFFEELEEQDYLNESVSQVYKEYKTYCIANNLQAVSSIEFVKQIKTQFNLEVKYVTIDKKRVRIYVRE